MRSMNIAATGMLAQQLNVEVIANNIANLSTSGFKRSRVEFQDLLYQNLRRPGSESSDTGTIVPSGVQVGLGVKPAAVYRINDQGSILVSGNPLDVAINGRGYLQVQLPDGENAYTRAGSLQMNAQGVIVNADGYPVQPQITIPADATTVTINASGQVLVKVSGQQTETNVGQIQLANFANPAGLEAIGNNLSLETAASGTATLGNPDSVGFGNLQQGALEVSNVNVVSEVTNLINAQRAYEMNSRVIRASDEMMSATTQAIR